MTGAVLLLDLNLTCHNFVSRLLYYFFLFCSTQKGACLLLWYFTVTKIQPKKKHQPKKNIFFMKMKKNQRNTNPAKFQIRTDTSSKSLLILELKSSLVYLLLCVALSCCVLLKTGGFNTSNHGVSLLVY